MKRQLFDKDVLRTGRWMVGDRCWDVTAALLRRLVQNFQLARSRGVRIPVVWNHSNDARDKIGEVVRLYVVGDTLRARFWAAIPEDIRRLNLTSDEASVEVAEPWNDGSGRRYDSFLTHVAIVNHPVVLNQGPIYRLQLSQATRQHEQGESMTRNDSPEAHHAVDGTPSSFDMATIVQLINEMMGALGTSYQLAEDTDESNFESRLRDLRDRIDAVVSDHDPSPDQSADTPVSASLQQQLDSVTRQLANHRHLLNQEREQAFGRAMDRLITEGRLTPADRESLLEAARPAGYSLSLLGPFERMPAGGVIPTSPAAR
ncbi:phage protease, partial [bacterium]|nr:phage protease [bacterium]